MTYQNRPLYLHEMCLALFAISYQIASQIPKNINFVESICESFGEQPCHKIIHWAPSVDKKLPKYIKIHVTEQKYMRLRSYPAILRRHHYNTSNPHEYMYSELLLFYPWQNERELHDNDYNKCLPKFSEIIDNHNLTTKIEYIKKNLFPNSCNIENSTRDVSTARRLQHIADTLDSTIQQEEADDFEEGVQVDEEHASRHLLDLYVNPQSKPYEYCFKVTKFIAEKKEEMLTKVRQLVPEQKIPFNILIKYAKDIRMILDHKREDTFPSPPLLVVHGGAGAGKSTVI